MQVIKTQSYTINFLITSLIQLLIFSGVVISYFILLTNRDLGIIIYGISLLIQGFVIFHIIDDSDSTNKHNRATLHKNEIVNGRINFKWVEVSEVVGLAATFMVSIVFVFLLLSQPNTAIMYTGTFMEYAALGTMYVIATN